jgi:ATPase subunit of ABC transporter with duplicated ATPase domains
VERGSKIAFVGQNGQGKSTFIKAIVNEFEYEGDIKLGHNVQVGYFAQNQAEYLDGEITYFKLWRMQRQILIVQKCAICWVHSSFVVTM